MNRISQCTIKISSIKHNNKYIWVYIYLVKFNFSKIIPQFQELNLTQTSY